MYIIDIYAEIWKLHEKISNKLKIMGICGEEKRGMYKRKEQLAPTTFYTMLYFIKKSEANMTKC